MFRHSHFFYKKGLNKNIKQNECDMWRETYKIWTKTNFMSFTVNFRKLWSYNLHQLVYVWMKEKNTYFAMNLRTLLAYNFASRFSASDGTYKGSHSTSKWFMNWQRSKITCLTCQNFNWTMNFLFVINDEIYMKVALCVQKMCLSRCIYTSMHMYAPDYAQHIHMYTQIHIHTHVYA